MKKKFLESFGTFLMNSSQARQILGGYGTGELQCRCHSYNSSTGTWTYDNSGCWSYPGSSGGSQNWPTGYTTNQDIAQNCASGVGQCNTTPNYCYMA